MVSTQPPVTIIGAGGIGCALADALISGDVQVTIVESDPAKVEWGRRHGLGYEDGPSHEVPLVSFEEWTPPDTGLVLLCVKCFDNDGILRKLPDTVDIIPVQNGFDRQLVTRCRYEGIASFVSECHAGQTSTRHTRDGALHLGPCSPESTGPLPPAIASLVETLKKHGRFSVVPVEHVLPYKYSKLMYNAAISPLAAVTGLDNGSLLTRPRARRLFFRLLKENYRILNRAGIELETIGPFHPSTVNRILQIPMLATCMAPSFARSLKDTYCSMSGDIEKGRTEIDNFNGHLIELAGDSPCPLNRTACDLVHRMADEQATPALDRLDGFDS